MHRNATAVIAEWITGNGPAAMPPQAVALIKRAVLDTVAVTLLGARMDAPRKVAALESAVGTASVFAMGRKTDPLAAALINGVSSHAELFDDNNAPMIAHPSGPLLSALLLTATWAGIAAFYLWAGAEFVADGRQLRVVQDPRVADAGGAAVHLREPLQQFQSVAGVADAVAAGHRPVVAHESGMPARERGTVASAQLASRSGHDQC